MSEFNARLDALFESALKLPAGERSGFVRSSTDDDELQRQLSKLLGLCDDHTHADFLASLGGQRLEDWIAQQQNDGDGTKVLSSPELDTSFSGKRIRSRDHRSSGQLPIRFGDYELVREIAHGGMGVVYEAKQLALNRTVALKMILAGEFADDEQIRRFQMEAEAAANLDHPGIVPIHEVGEIGGRHFFSMGYVDGEGLDQQIQESPLASRHAATYLRKIAGAIDYAHSQGVLHRDLKPSNVLVDKNDEPRITDFGLAKRIGSDVELTASGQILGTPGYMPPEQARGEWDNVDARSDVYALGALLYALMTGRPPFQADNVVNTLTQICSNEPVSPRLLNPAIDLDLETICLRCLEKDPSCRYQSAGELESEARRYLRGEPIVARPIGRVQTAWRWCKRNSTEAWLGAAIVLVLITGTIVSTLFGIRANRKADEARQHAGVAELESKKADRERRNAISMRDLANSNARSASANELKAKQLAEQERRARIQAETRAYAALISNAQSAWNEYDVELAVKQLRECPWHLRGWEHDYLSAIFSSGHEIFYGQAEESFLAVAAEPKGKLIASNSQLGGISLWDTGTRTRIGLLDSAQQGVACLAFDRNGRWLAAGCKDGVVEVWDVANKEVFQTLEGHEGSVNDLAFNSDGTQIVSAGAGGKVILWHVKSKDVIREFLQHEGAVNSVALCETKSCLVSGGDDGVVNVWDIRSGDLVSSFSGHTWQVTCVSIESESEVVASGGADGLVRLSRIHDGHELGVLKGHLRRVTDIVVLPKEGTIVSSSDDKTIRVWNLADWSLRATLRGHTQSVSDLATLSATNRVVSCSLDGTIRDWELQPTPRSLERIELKGRIFDLNEDWSRAVIGGKGGYVVVNVNDGDELFSAKSGVAVALSPTGDQLATSDVEGTVYVHTQGKESTKELTCKDNTTPFKVLAISPSAKWLAGGTFDGLLCIWNLHTGEEKFHSRAYRYDITTVKFSPDGKRLLTCSTSERRPKIWNVNAEALEATLVGHSGFVGFGCFSSDGHLVYTSGLDNKLIEWDAATGRPVRTFAGQDKPAVSLACSSDGCRLWTGGSDGIIRAWDIATAVETFRTNWTRQGHVYVRPCPIDDRLFVVGREESIVLLAPQRGDRRKLSGHAVGPVTAVVFAGENLISGGTDGTLRVWNTHTGRNETTLVVSEASISGIAVGPREGRILCGSRDGRIRVCDLETGDVVREFDADDGGVRALAVSPNGKTIVSGGASGRLSFWDGSTFEKLHDVDAHDGGVNCVLFDRAGERVYSCAMDGKIHVYDANHGTYICSMVGHDGPVYDIAFSPVDDHIATAGFDGTIRIWSETNQEQVRVIPCQCEGLIYCISYSPDGARIVSLGNDDTVRIWDSIGNFLGVRSDYLRHRYDQRVTLSLEASLADSVAFDSQGEFIAVAGFEKSISFARSQTVLKVE